MTSDEWLPTVLPYLAKLIFKNGGIEVRQVGFGGLDITEAFALVRLEGMIDAFSLAENWSEEKIKNVWAEIEQEITTQSKPEPPKIVLPHDPF